MLELRRIMSVAGLVVVLAACHGTGPSNVTALTTLNNSGVTGTVTLTAVDGSHTRVEIQVNAAGHNDMPSHIHPGNCATLVPQPKYPLQSVTFGRSTTVIAASMAELTQGGLAVNLHNSNEDMATYAACAELK